MGEYTAASGNNGHQPKIVHLTTGSGLATGGAGMMLYKLLSATDRSRFTSMLILLMDKGRLGGRIEELGIPVYAMNMPRGGLTAAGLWRLVRVVRDLRPDIIQGWAYHGNIAASATGAMVHPARVLWNVRHTPYDLRDYKPMTAMMIRLGARLSRRPARIIYNSNVSAAQHERLGYAGAPRVIIPNGFDLAQFAPSPAARSAVRAELGIDQEAPLVGLVARYHPQKDHANFVQAAARLCAWVPESHFLLCGDGITWDNPELAGWIVDAGLGDCFHLLGQRDDIPRLMAALDVAGTASSFGEAFPNVVGEAMACGVPCVVTDVGDSARIVGETGIVVPRRDPRALAGGWRRLLVDMSREERQALGLAARERIAERYSLAAVAGQYERLYASLLAA